MDAASPAAGTPFCAVQAVTAQSCADFDDPPRGFGVLGAPCIGAVCSEDDVASASPPRSLSIGLSSPPDTVAHATWGGVVTVTTPQTLKCEVKWLVEQYASTGEHLDVMGLRFSKDGTDVLVNGIIESTDRRIGFFGG